MRRIPSLAGKILMTLAAVSGGVFLLVRAVSAHGSHTRVPMISDWSHRHLIFSQPTSYEKAWRLQSDPRYFQQVVRRSGRGGAVHEPESDGGRFGFPGLDWRQRQREKPFARDWGQSLGAGGSVGVPLPSGGTTWFPAYPAKFSFDVNATPDCTNDFVVFTTNLPGAAAQASIIAYNKLYSGGIPSFCALSLAPTVYWSYNTNFDASGAATTGTVATSPVLSADGKRVAFVENRATGGAIVHLLKWNAGDGGAIGTAANPTISTSWTACPATGACMISLVFNNGNADIGSSPFYDYARDALYVGDDSGVLHKFVNAFGATGATPVEVTSGWPITVDATQILTSPVLDGVSGNIFTADTLGTISYVRETFSSAGTCKTGSVPCLGSTNIPAPSPHNIPDAPLVDPVTEKVFVFMSNFDGTNAAVIQSDTTLSTSVSATLGLKGLGHHLHSGAFDNGYLTGNGSAGRLYMCGSSATNLPTIQRIGFSNSGRMPLSPFANPVGTMNPAVDVGVALQVASTAEECAPLTEFFNPNATTNQDQIFFGMQASGSGANCAGAGCVMSINVTGIPATISILSSIAEVGGPSGIIVDNDANTTPVTGAPQASSLYFSNQGNSTTAAPCGLVTGVGCAVKVTQAGLN
jgi:hypothetical protein